MRLITPMGGPGTRLRPFSLATPKALLPVAGQPAVARSLGAFADALSRPVEEVVFVLNRADRQGEVLDALTAACETVGVRARFAVQSKPLGTAHATGSAGDALDGEVLTVWSDTLFRAKRRSDRDGAAPADLAAWTIEVEDPRRFGVVTRDAKGVVTGLLEKPPDPRFTETLIGAYYVRDGATLRRQIESMMAHGATGAGGGPRRRCDRASGLRLARGDDRGLDDWSLREPRGGRRRRELDAAECCSVRGRRGAREHARRRRCRPPGPSPGRCRERTSGRRRASRSSRGRRLHSRRPHAC